MALPEDKVLEEEDDFLDVAGDVLAAPFRGVEGAIQGAYNLADYLAFDVLPDYDTRFLGTSKTMAGGAVEGISQFATGFIPLFGLAGRAGALAKAGTATKAVIAGAATDFTFFNGQEARLSNLIQQVPELQNPVTEFLAYDGDESELEGRMKNVLEGLGLEAVAGVFIKSLKAIKNGRKAKDGGADAVGQAQAVVDTGIEQDLASIKDIAEPGVSRRSGIFAGRIDDKTKDFLIKGTQASEVGGQAPTIGRTLDQLAVNADTPEVQNLAKNLKKIIKNEDDLNVTVNYKPDVDGDPATVRGDVGDKGSIAGVYKPSADRVELYGRADEQTLVHEMLHGVTAKKINAWVSQGGADRSLVLSNIDNVINNKAAPKPIRELAKSFKLAAEKVGKEYEFKGTDVFDPKEGKGLYAFKDLDEFLVAAFTDLELQRILRRIPADDQRNIFQKIVDAVAELIGTIRGEGGSNLLDKVLRDSAQIISASRDSYMGKAKLVAEGRYYQTRPNLWSVPEQEITSAATSINVAKLPAAYNKLKKAGIFTKGMKMVDIGGGKFDNAVDMLKGEGVDLKVYDPFNRSAQHNKEVAQAVQGGQVDAAISNNVLNVIKEKENQLLVVEQAFDAVKGNGKAYFSVYEGSKSGTGKETKAGFQHNKKTAYYVSLVEDVFGKGNVEVKNNIITATKQADEGLASVKQEMPDFKKGATDEVLQAIPEKFREYAKELMGGGTPRLPRFALETSDDVIVLKDLLESYYKENPDKITVEGAVLELDAEIEKSLMLQEGKDAATKIAEARIVQQSIRDQGVAVVNNLADAVKAFEKAGGGDVAIADIKNNFQQLLSIADVYRKLGRQGSLLLGSRREGFTPRKIGLSEADFKIDGLRKEFANASGMDPKKMVDLINEHIDPNDPVGSLERLFKTAKKAQGKSMLDMPIEYWMNAILSGPKTQVVNAMGNSITQIMTSIETVLGGVASGNMDVIKAVFAAWADGKMYSEAASFAKKAFKQSDNVLDPNARAFSDRPDVAISGQRVSEAMPGKALSEETERGIDWFANNIIRIPSRLLMTTDEFFKQLAYRRAARLKAAMSGLQQGIRDPQALAEHINKTLEGVITEGGRMGSEEGLAREAYDIFKSKSEFKPSIEELDALENKKRRTDLTEAESKRLTALKIKVGKDRNKFVLDYVQKNFDDTKSALIQYAQDEARYLTFTKELEPGLGKGLQNITNNIPAARLILPFVRTPTNILSFALERTPLNIPLTKESWERFNLEIRNPDPIVKAQARGKLATAALVGYTLMEAVQNGNGSITGGGPSDERQKKALQAAGWQPYSIKIGDEYYSYQRLDPIATPLGIIADIVETGVLETKDFNETELEHATQSFLLAMTRNVTNKSYLAGIQTFTDALSDPDRFVPRFGRNFVSSFVPNLISQMADSDTQAMKESRSVMDAVKKKLGDRSGLDSKRNVLGEEIMMEAMFDSPLQFFNPIAFSTKKDDLVLQEMASLNHAFRLPPPNLGGQIDMLAYKSSSGQSAYDRWQELLQITKIGGQSLRQTLTRLIKSRDYKQLSPESEPGLESPRITQINNILTKYRKEARKRLMREFPELDKQYSALTLAKTRFKTGVSREDVLALLTQ